MQLSQIIRTKRLATVFETFKRQKAHLPQPKPRESPAVARKQFVQNAALDPDLAFLKDTPEFNELLKQYAD